MTIEMSLIPARVITALSMKRGERGEGSTGAGNSGGDGIRVVSGRELNE